MTFHWPLILWCLTIPALLWIIAFLRNRRATIRHNTPTKIIEAQAYRNTLVVGHGGARTRRRVRWRFYLGLAAAIVAFARPQWGRIDEPIFDEARDILIALDLSRSMHATDVKPSRLDRAKLLIASLLDRLEGERVGLVVFAGTAFLQSPLSADYEILRDFLPSLDSDLLPQGGSNYRQLLDTSLEAFSPSSAADRYLIVLSDGEATDEAWRASVDKLKKQNVRVIGLGVGTADGSMIPDGAGGFVKDERGAVVLSRLESRTLQELAEATNGVYTDASTWVDLPRLIESTVETGRKELLAERRRVRLAERFQWALAPALLLLAWSFWREFPVRPRVRDLQLKTSTPPPLPRAAASPTPHSASTPPPLPTVVALVLIGLTFGTAPRIFAQEPTTPPDTATIAQPLSKLVAQLSARPALTAANHAEIARTTITYGERLEAIQHPVPEGPVRDALLAVDAGQKQNPAAANWDELRARLEKFLEKPEDQQQEQQQEQEKKDQEKKDQKDKSDQPSSPQSGGESDQQKDQEKSDKQDSTNQPSQSSPSGEQSQDKPPQQQPTPGSSAFGDMQEQTTPPDKPQQPSEQTEESSGETQTVGTAQQQTTPVDPSLSIPLQKLEQVRNQDSPARLFQLMQDPNAQPEKPGKDW